MLRPVLVESIISQIMDRIHLRPRPPDRPPVKLQPLPADCEENMDMTCAICLEENTAPLATGCQKPPVVRVKRGGSGANGNFSCIMGSTGLSGFEKCPN